MPTILTGTLTSDAVLAGKQVRDVTKGLSMKYVDLNPLTAVLMKMPKGRTLTNYKAEWTRKDLLPRWDVISAVSGASGATITVTPTNVSYFKVGDVVQIPQLNPSATQTDIGVVTTKTTTIVVTAVGWQSNLAASAATFPTVSAGMNLQIIIDASEEYSQKPAMKVTKDEQEWNYIHFARAPYNIGNIEADVPAAARKPVARDIDVHFGIFLVLDGGNQERRIKSSSHVVEGFPVPQVIDG